MEGMETKMKGCNRYCLSSQMFFVVSLFTFLVYLFIIGFTTIIASQFNIFKDPYLIFIAVFWLGLLTLFEKGLNKLMYFFDIWDYAHYEAGGNRVADDPDELPSAEQENQQINIQSSIGSSEIRFTFKQLGQDTVPKEEFNRERENKDNKDNKDKDDRENRRQVLRAKLKTTCKKLEPAFEREDFRMDYAVKNKDYIRTNIEDILPLITAFPENDTHWLGRGESSHERKTKKRETRNIDPGVS